MKKYYLTITFFISLLLHSFLLLFLIQSDAQKLKKGVGEDARIKISSFEVASFDAPTKTPQNSPPIQKKASKEKTLKDQKIPNRNLKEKKSSPIANQTHQQSNQENQEDNQQEEALNNFDTSLPNQLDEILPKVPIEQRLSYQLADPQTKQDIYKFYGAEFGQLGLEEQEYILNNLAYIGRITQRYLRYPPNAGMLAQSGGNVIEFYLHPNGDISDLKIIKQSGFILLDRNSIKTIEIAYKDYPHPKTKTLIRFHINYYLR